MIEDIFDPKLIDRLWDKYSQESTFRTMYVNFHNNLMRGYVEDVVFEEFRLKKKIKDEILSDLRYTVYDLSKDDINNLNFPVLSNRLLEIVQTVCKDNQVSESRIDSMMRKLGRSLHTDFERGWIKVLRIVFLYQYMSDYEDDEI